jgi:hypothetical protein
LPDPPDVVAAAFGALAGGPFVEAEVVLDGGAAAGVTAEVSLGPDLGFLGTVVLGGLPEVPLTPDGRFGVGADIWREKREDESPRGIDLDILGEIADGKRQRFQAGYIKLNRKRNEPGGKDCVFYQRWPKLTLF